MNFAIFNGDLNMIKYFAESNLIKTSVKMPSSQFSREKQMLFPLAISFDKDDQKMFEFYLNSFYFLWKDDQYPFYLLNLIMTSAREKEIKTKYMQILMKSKPLITIFHRMSFQYRASYIQNLIGIYDDVDEGSAQFFVDLCDELTE